MRCEFKIHEQIDNKFIYKCSNCGYITRPYSFPPEKVFKTCSNVQIEPLIIKDTNSILPQSNNGKGCGCNKK